MAHFLMYSIIKYNRLRLAIKLLWAGSALQVYVILSFHKEFKYIFIWEREHELPSTGSGPKCPQQPECRGWGPGLPSSWRGPNHLTSLLPRVCTTRKLQSGARAGASETDKKMAWNTQAISTWNEIIHTQHKHTYAPIYMGTLTCLWKNGIKRNSGCCGAAI